MNKVGKTAVYMMGAGTIAMASYYMGLPKSKKNAIKDKMKTMMKMEKDCMEDIYCDK